MILAVGSLLHLKGFHILISACAELDKMGVCFLCKIIGEGVERGNLETKIENLQMTDKVQLPGYRTIDELFEEYTNASVFVMPSVPSSIGTDGLPTVIIEAMAAGLPVVATRHAGIPDLVIDGETGLLVNPGDISSLADAIKEMISNKELYSKFAVQGRQKVENEFDLKKNNKIRIELIEAAVSATKQTQ